MAVSGNFYGQALAKALNKEIDVDSDAIKGMLCTSSYTPNLATHAYKSDITFEVSGTGYTAGGNTLTSVTLGYVVANSWPTTRLNSTAYVAGEVVRPASGNGFLYQCITSGTSGGSVPTYPTTIGGTVTDGTVVWMCVATGAVVFDAADMSWPSSTITAQFLVIYDSTPSTDATRPLLVVVNFGTNIVSAGGPFSVAFDGRGIAAMLVP